jgi:beta-galactosidase
MDTTRRTVLKLAAGAVAAAQTQHLHGEWLSFNEALTTRESAPPATGVSQQIFSVAGFYPAPDESRKVVNFNPGWRFRKSDEAGAERIDFDDARWEPANLPHGLEILPENASGNRNYQGPAWYRKRVALRPGPNSRTFFYLEAAMGKCTVWVNEQKVAEHFGGYLPIAADVTDALHLGKNGNHVFAVRVDNSDDPTYPPGKPQRDLDFTYLGGIYRDAFLIQTGSVHITLPEISRRVAGGGVFVGVKQIRDTNALLEVRTEVANARMEAAQIRVRTTLEDALGSRLLEREKAITLSPGASEEVVESLGVENAHLWHPNDPYLHFIHTEVIEHGVVVDSTRTRFGIRLYEMRAQDGLFINGKYIGYKLSGANRHQDYAYVGNALPKSGQWRDAHLLREGGCTIIRAAHEPMAPAFLDACDQLGLLVTGVNPGWQFYNAKDPRFRERLIDDTRQLVRRDRNRPSILLWETAINETPDQSIEAVHQLHLTAHAEYPYPGLYTATDRDIAKPAGMDFYYYAQKTDPVCSFVREYGDGDEVDNFYSHNAQVRVKREWGEHAMLNQLRIRATDLDAVFSAPRQQIGSALWAGIDHQRGYHPDPFWGGLANIFRIPRYSYYLFKSQYDPGLAAPGIETGPMVFIANELTQVSERDVIVLSNCEEVRLTWMGKVIGTQRPDPGYAQLPHPPITFKDVFDFHRMKREHDRTGGPFPKMIAEGLAGGKVVCTQAKIYAERTTGVKLSLEGRGFPLVADGSDFVPVFARIVDQKGTHKVLATEYVFFEVEGPGDIIGGRFNQANPTRTEFGSAVALIRARTTAGKIHVKAYVNGLAPDEITFDSIPSALPLSYDGDYARESATPAPGEPALMNLPGSSSDATVRDLRRKVNDLELQLTDKEQQLMNLKNKLKAQ